jgi:hypothetical protein
MKRKLEKSATPEPQAAITEAFSYFSTPTHVGIELGFIVIDSVLVTHHIQL